ncbi:MAG: pectate lyase [Cellvibrio sp.]|uniref:pectate lyase family protein n=1 Tax=Cellvibrio sp. TaxID=1965322 RepID=UPI002723CE72|nr:pectate lyase [Cellvibrio sp.]
MSTTTAPSGARKSVRFSPAALAAAIAMCASTSAFAASTGGFSTTDGGNVSGSKSFSASTHTQIQQIIEDAKDGDYPVVITYTGNEDSLINQIVRDHTVDSSGNCPRAHWNDTYRKVEIKEMTKGVTIQGANGSSANFGIVVNKSSNVIIRNMKIGALGGANNDADMIRVDSGVNVWIDHNELFAVNNECKGSPDGDLTFESAIDIKKASQNITVSYNVIRDSKKVGLDGSSSSDIAGGRKITFHHNIYRNVGARLPLQRGGWTHMYNNLYDGITSSGINVRQNGYALIESNWFQNAVNPVTCRFDSSNCGKWDLRNNNIRNPGDFATYNITWTSGGTIDATNWTTTAPFPISIPYSYAPVTPQCVKDRLASYAGVGKNGTQLTASACGGAASSTPASSAPKSSSSAANSSAASGSVSLGGSAGNGSVALNWTVNANINALEIYQDTDSNPSGRVRIASLPTNTTNYTATGLSNGTTYYFWVKYRTTDNVWSNSNVFSAKPSSGTVSSSSSSSAASSTPSGAPVLSGTGDYPSGFSKCADLGGTCTVSSGDGWVAFGRKGKWVTKKVNVGSSIACTVAAFGSDPQGNPNKCSYKK